jgi:hypothetical protein
MFNFANLVIPPTQTAPATEQAEPAVADPAATAKAILAAGHTARTGGTAMPKPTGIAEQILAAGRKRRGED